MGHCLYIIIFSMIPQQTVQHSTMATFNNSSPNRVSVKSLMWMFLKFWKNCLEIVILWPDKFSWGPYKRAYMAAHQRLLWLCRKYTRCRSTPRCRSTQDELHSSSYILLWHINYDHNMFTMKHVRTWRNCLM